MHPSSMALIALWLSWSTLSIKTIFDPNKRIEVYLETSLACCTLPEYKSQNNWYKLLEKKDIGLFSSWSSGRWQTDRIMKTKTLWWIGLGSGYSITCYLPYLVFLHWFYVEFLVHAIPCTIATSLQQFLCQSIGSPSVHSLFEESC